MKKRRSPNSDLSQARAREKRRRDPLRAETDRYLDELAAELGGPPTTAELSAADRWLDRAVTRTTNPRPS